MIAGTRYYAVTGPLPLLCDTESHKDLDYSENGPLADVVKKAKAAAGV